MISHPPLGRVLALALLLVPSLALAHGSNAPYIAFWGPFSTAAARCQRQIGASVGSCVERVVRHELECSNAPASSGCDEIGRAAARQAALVQARQQVASMCSVAEVRELLFVDVAEAETDVDQACDRETTRLYSHLLAGDLPQLDDRCRRELQVVGRQMLRRALQAKRFALNPITVHDMLPSRRLGRINDCQRRLTKTRGRLADRLRRHCPQLETVYGASAEAWLLDVDLSADCAVWAAYIQSAFTCARP